MGYCGRGGFFFLFVCARCGSLLCDYRVNGRIIGFGIVLDYARKAESGFVVVLYIFYFGFGEHHFVVERKLFFSLVVGRFYFRRRLFLLYFGFFDFRYRFFRNGRRSVAVKVGNYKLNVVVHGRLFLRLDGRFNDSFRLFCKFVSLSPFLCLGFGVFHRDLLVLFGLLTSFAGEFVFRFGYAEFFQRFKSGVLLVAFAHELLARRGLLLFVRFRRLIYVEQIVKSVFEFGAARG